mgnify:CR=1 FL=1
MSQLGQIFTRLGEMFSGAGNVMTGGNAVRPGQLRPGPPAGVELDRLRRAGAREDQRRDRRRRAPGRDVAGRGDRPARGHHQGRRVDPNDWIDNTLDTWKRLCDPVAEQISTVWASALPEEAKSMAGPLLAMMSQMGGMAFGSQLGQALGKLSREVLTSTDIGLPLGPKGVAALMPDAVESLAEGLEQPRSEIITFLAAARGRAPPAVQPRAVAVQPAAQRRRGLRQGHEDRHERHRGLRARVQPGVADRSVGDGAAAQSGHLRAEGDAGTDRGAGAAGDAAGADRGLGADRRRPTRSATGSPARPR